MNIDEYNRKSSEPYEDRKTKNQNPNRKKKKKFRLDKLIGYITILTIVVFATIIYNDTQSIGKNLDNKNNTNKNNAIELTDEKSSEKVTDRATNNRIVCIDAGHGGSDRGAVSNGYTEKDQTLEIAKLIQQALEAQGIKVVMTRTTDSLLSVEKRLEIAKSSKAGIIVSVHRNYYTGSSSVSGVEAWIHNSEPSNAKSLANNILTQLVKSNGFTNRGVKSGTIADNNKNYYLNSDSQSTSCVLELGFISNANDNTLVTTYKTRCAKSIAQGIMNYMNELER